MEFVLTPAGAGLCLPPPTRAVLGEGLPGGVKSLGSLGLCAGVAPPAEDIPTEESCGQKRDIESGGRDTQMGERVPGMEVEP